jgi:CBS domain-containing protein
MWPCMDNQAQKISSSAMLSEASERMKALDVDRLSVMENKDIIGTVTEDDIAGAVAAGIDLTRTPVKYAMTLAATEDRPEDVLAKAAALEEDG